MEMRLEMLESLSLYRRLREHKNNSHKNGSLSTNKKVRTGNHAVSAGGMLTPNIAK